MNNLFSGDDTPLGPCIFDVSYDNTLNCIHINIKNDIDFESLKNSLDAAVDLVKKHDNPLILMDASKAKIRISKKEMFYLPKFILNNLRCPYKLKYSIIGERCPLVDFYMLTLRARGQEIECFGSKEQAIGWLFNSK